MSIPQSPPAGSHRMTSRQRGYVMVLAAVLLSGLMAVSMVAVQRTRHGTSAATHSYHETRVFYAAEGGSARAQAWLTGLLAVNADPSTEQLAACPIPMFENINFLELDVTRLPRITGATIPSGPFAGLTADITPYRIRSHTENTSSTVDAIVTVTMNQQSIGMYQFGIFYDGDLELCPSMMQTDYVGRIHTNGDLYLTSANELDITGTVTATGSIFNTPKDPTQVLRGKARIQDGEGHWQDLSYDSRDPDWATQALEDWDGRVMDSAHGVGELGFPLPVPSTSIEVIKRGLPGDDAQLREMRMYWKAGLRIVDGAATDSAGNPVALPAGIITPSIVYDYRESAFMAMTDLDLAALQASGFFPANGVIYVSGSAPHAAVRLINGQQLPAGGLALGSDNPVYVRGHYNIISKQPASILCDAFNVYSINWSDANSTRGLNKRIAASTMVNTCVVAGNVPTTDGNYSGGAENLIRLHEKWVGHELTYRGSLICIWESEQATGLFENASFIEAHRDWGFDPALLDPDFWPEDQMALRSLVRGTWTSQ